MEDNRPIHQDTQEYSEATKRLQPQKVSTRHRALMRRLIAGVPLKDAAEELGYTVARASLIANSPLFKEEKRKMEEEVYNEFVRVEGEKPSLLNVEVAKKILSDASIDAANVLVGELRAETSRERQMSAREILDRSGVVAPPQKIEGKMEIDVDASEGLIMALNRAVEEMRCTSRTSPHTTGISYVTNATEKRKEGSVMDEEKEIIEEGKSEIEMQPPNDRPIMREKPTAESETVREEEKPVVQEEPIVREEDLESDVTESE